MTQFKRSLRSHQARWRVARGLQEGEHPPGQANGSVLSWAEGEAFANFLSPAIIRSVEHRLAAEQREKGQQFDPVRLKTHLLSSMPMCFNLFGELHGNPERITTVGQKLWGLEQPGLEVRFEWSPGRGDPDYSGDGTAFDVALLFGDADEQQTVIGIETKYHEHAVAEATPKATTRLPRYREIAERSGAFAEDWEDRILGTPLQQIWRDHLLLLSLLQHPSRRWGAGKYVLVYPAGNAAFDRLGQQYREVLADESTFDIATIESLLDAHALHEPETERKFRERYVPG
jgi:hypothetical protein